MNRFHLWSLTLGLWLLAWRLAPLAVATPTFEQEQEIRTAFVTPHTSPSGLAAYRRYLQGVYGDIATLNDSWRTDYAAFEAITLLDPADPTEARAKQARNFARWYDRQAWESANFLGLNRRFGEAFPDLWNHRFEPPRRCAPPLLGQGGEFPQPAWERYMSRMR